MLHVVLYEPEIPANTGNAIRLCANTGATLHLVKPLGFRLDDKSLRRSRLDYGDLADVRIHADFAACLALLPSRVFAVETGGHRGYCETAFLPGDAVVFGAETKGMPQSVLDYLGLENLVSIPMRPASRSINLSNAVAVVVFEAWRQSGFSGGVLGGCDIGRVRGV